MDDVSLAGWLESLAAKKPTPGGGAVAALAAAISAAQLEMVAAYTTGPKWQDSETRMKELIKKLGGLRSDALALVQADAEAFAKVGSAYQMPKETEDEKTIRKSAVQKALAEAAGPPTKTAQLAARLVEIAAELAKTGNQSVISDVAVGASMARVALEAAIVNIEINAHALEDALVQKTLRAAVGEATGAIQDAGTVTGAVRDRLAAS